MKKYDQRLECWNDKIKVGDYEWLELKVGAYLWLDIQDGKGKDTLGGNTEGLLLLPDRATPTFVIQRDKNVERGNRELV